MMVNQCMALLFVLRNISGLLRISIPINRRIEDIIKDLRHSSSRPSYIAAFPFFNEKNAIVYNLIHCSIRRGVEYGDYTMNHVLGRSHGCKYPCYAFLLNKRFGQLKTYEDWCRPFLVSNTLELLDKEIPRL